MILTQEAGIAYRIALFQNRRFISLPVGIRTHDLSVTDKANLPPSVAVKRCLSNGVKRCQTAPTGPAVRAL